MKREVKIILLASLVAISLILIPLFLAKSRHNREDELLQRKPKAATLKFRGAIRGTTQINVFFGVVEADTPGNQIPPTRKPDLVLSGDKVSEIVRALHFEWGDGSSIWQYYSGPYAGAIYGCTALEFTTNGKKLADLRLGSGSFGDLGTRWYKPPTYIGDSRLLSASRDYLERQFNRKLGSY